MIPFIGQSQKYKYIAMENISVVAKDMTVHMTVSVHDYICVYDGTGGGSFEAGTILGPDGW